MSKNRIFILNDPYAPRLNSQLAKEIGLNESIILLQLEYWISISNNNKDGYIWTYQSASSIQNLFCFYSTSTINRTIKNLLEMGLIIEGNYNKKKFDRTRWFTLNYENLSKLRSIKIEGYDYNIERKQELDVLQIDINQNDLSTSQNEPCQNQIDSRQTQYDSCQTQYDSCQTQYDSCQTQYESCQTQYESTIPKITTKIKDLKDSPRSKVDPRPPSIKILSDDVYKITDEIINKISLNHPKAILPEKEKANKHYEKWASEIDKLNRIGPPGGSSGYSFEEISKIARWALDNSFWSINIQSTSKLRAKIITLEAQYKSSLNKSKPKNVNSSTSNNKFHNFTKSSVKYTNDQLEKMLGVK